jgi:ribosomal protein L18E
LWKISEPKTITKKLEIKKGDQKMRHQTEKFADTGFISQADLEREIAKKSKTTERNQANLAKFANEASLPNNDISLLAGYVGALDAALQDRQDTLAAQEIMASTLNSKRVPRTAEFASQHAWLLERAEAKIAKIRARISEICKANEVIN